METTPTPYVRLSEVAQYLGIVPRAVWQAFRRGPIPGPESTTCPSCGYDHVWSRAAVEEWQNDRRASGLLRYGNNKRVSGRFL